MPPRAVPINIAWITENKYRARNLANASTHNQDIFSKLNMKKRNGHVYLYDKKHNVLITI